MLFYNIKLILINLLGLFTCTSHCITNDTTTGPDNICERIIQRKRWGARTETGLEYLIIPVQFVVIHHTVTPECTTKRTCSDIVYNIQNYHMNSLENWDIGYNFIIGGDGNVYEGTGYYHIGAHTFGWNRKSLGIAFIGDFSDKLPPKKALDAAKGFLECSVNNTKLDEDYTLYGGRQLVALESPGLELYNEIIDWDHWSSQIKKTTK